MQRNHPIARLLAAWLTTAIVTAYPGSGHGGSLSAYRHVVLEGHSLKWGAPAFGTGARVTYAVIRGKAQFAGARNCPAIEPLTGLLTANAISPKTFAAELEAAFAAWSNVADITFAPALPVNADILLGAQSEPRLRAFTNVTYTSPPKAAETAILNRPVICLNPEQRWKVGFDGNLDVYDLRYVLTHEIGHAIGLDHPGSRDALMDFRYREQFREPQPSDVAGAISLYGPSRVAGVVDDRPMQELSELAGTTETVNR